VDRKLMEKGVALILQGMGEDPNSPDFKDTPKRVAKMYAELLTPKPSHWNTFPAASSDMVLLRGHRVVGLCPHHLMPVEYVCNVGYIPGELTVGLSKLARVVEVQLMRPVMQEDLANDIANALHEKLKPKGVGVVLAGIHGCMRFRGVKSEGDVVVSAMRGILLLNPTARSEFLQLIADRRR
jgi:GTP cyclohydrolase I